MPDTALSLGIVGAYLVVVLAVGLLAYRLTDRRAEDYYLASRSLGTVVLLFTTFATLLSAFTFFAGPNIAYGAGPEWILVMGLMDGVLFGVLWYVVGYKQWRIGRREGHVTLGELLGARFGSRRLRGIVAGVSLFWLFPYVMLQQVGAGTALQALTGGDLPYAAGAGLITVFMIVYVVLSGMRGVAWTDTLQGLFMLGMVWAAFAWVLVALGGPEAATASMAEAAPEFLALGGSPAPGAPYSVQWMLSTAISIAFGVAMFPQVNQRFFVARSERVLKRSFALWPVLVVLLFVPAFMLGAWAVGASGVTVPEGGNVLPALLAATTPAWFAALVVAGAMAAMMSSSDSMLLSGASYFTRDLYRPFVDASISERREDLLGRVGVVVFASLAFGVSLLRPGTLFTIGETAFGGFAQLALPVLLALYWERTTETGMVAGVVGSQAFYLAHVFSGAIAGVGRELGLDAVPVLEWGVALFAALPADYAGWGVGLVGMGVGLVVTVGASLGSAPATDEDPAISRVSAD